MEVITLDAVLHLLDVKDISVLAQVCKDLYRYCNTSTVLKYLNNKYPFSSTSLFSFLGRYDDAVYDTCRCTRGQFVTRMVRNDNIDTLKLYCIVPLVSVTKKHAYRLLKYAIRASAARVVKYLIDHHYTLLGGMCDKDGDVDYKLYRLSISTCNQEIIKRVRPLINQGLDWQEHTCYEVGPLAVPYVMSVFTNDKSIMALIRSLYHITVIDDKLQKSSDVMLLSNNLAYVDLCLSKKMEFGLVNTETVTGAQYALLGYYRGWIDKVTARKMIDEHAASKRESRRRKVQDSF